MFIYFRFLFISMTERKTKHTIAVISGQQTFFYNGYFVESWSRFNVKMRDDFFCFFDEKDAAEYWIRWDKVIWVKEIK